MAVHCFDLLLVGGETLLDWPLRERLGELEGVLAVTDRRIGRATNVRTDSLSRGREFYQRVLDAGHEGVMVKNLDAGYRPGARVGYQAKLKATMEPLDLVVTRAIYSEGRKRGYLGRPYLAARGPGGTFQEVGRMHTGFTDEQLEAFTALLEPRIEEVDGREARVRPTVVLEVEFDEIQRSSTYESGFALRFPRLRRIRHDLGPEDAETIDRVRELFEAQ